MIQTGQTLRSLYSFFVKNVKSKEKRLKRGKIILNVYASILLSFWFCLIAAITYFIISNFDVLTATVFVLILGVFAICNAIDFEVIVAEFKEQLEDEIEN